MKLLFIVIFCGVLIGIKGVFAAPEKEAPSTILTAVLQAKTRIDTQPVDEVPDETFNSWDYALSKSDSKTGVLGVVSLWGKGQRSLVQLVWWRQKDPEVRKSILLLYYSLTKVEADNFPDFPAYAARFEKAEAEARKGEIEEAKKLADASRDELKKAFAAK
jgi:hypothetical protein